MEIYPKHECGNPLKVNQGHFYCSTCYREKEIVYYYDVKQYYKENY